MSLKLNFNFNITETKLVKNNLLTTIPRMSTEWSISFEYRMTGVNSTWSSIIDFVGQTILISVDMSPNSEYFYFVTPLDDAFNDYYHYNVQLNRVYKIEIHQRYISNGNYRSFIKIDGEQVYSAINSKARQYYNVKVHASRLEPASQGFISKLHFTNFL